MPWRELELRQKLFIPGLPIVGSHFVFTKLLESLSFIKIFCIKTCFCPLPVPRQCPLPVPSQYDKDVLSRPRAFNFLGRPRAESRAPKPWNSNAIQRRDKLLRMHIHIGICARDYSKVRIAVSIDTDKTEPTHLFCGGALRLFCKSRLF